MFHASMIGLVWTGLVVAAAAAPPAAHVADNRIAAALIFAGVLFHVFKQVASARKMDETLHLKAYVLQYPYQLGAMLIGGGVAFFVLLEMGQLNYASAFLAGYTANSLADMIGDRSKLATGAGGR